MNDVETLKPGRSWKDYSEKDIQGAAKQHGGTCLNARQALALDVLCACEGRWCKLTEGSSSTGEMPISELARLTNMSLLELIPEVVDMADRSPINQFSWDVDDCDRGQEPAVVKGELRVVAQVNVAVRAADDPHPGDKDLIRDQENGLWSPPSVDVPRVLTVGYWADWEVLDNECEDDDERQQLDDMIDRFRQAAAARAGIRASSRSG